MRPDDLTGDVIEPDLGRHILAELAELNSDFIELVHESSRDNSSDSLMPLRQFDALLSLRKPAIRRLTGCAFALFDLRLQDVALWRALAAGEIPDALSGTECNETTQRQVKFFTLSALMYLRHLAEVNRFFARLSFDASPETLDIIKTLPLNQIRTLADHCPGLLRGRFDDLPEAWSELLKLARRNDTEPMLPAKILGYQHLGQG